MHTAQPGLASYFSYPVQAAARMALFCLPYAGGGSAVFRDWIGALTADIDVQPIRLPGRESRIAEPAEIDISHLADAVATRIDRPYAIYGHSLGALIGFELIRELRHRGSPSPLRLYAAACRPPHVRDTLADAGRADDETLVNRLVELGGTPEGVLDNVELREMLMPALRADFAWFAAYTYRAEPPLALPIVGLAGTTDNVVPRAAMLEWACHSVAGFRLQTVPGGHFFVRQSTAALASLLSADLRCALDEAAVR